MTKLTKFGDHLIDLESIIYVKRQIDSITVFFSGGEKVLFKDTVAEFIWKSCGGDNEDSSMPDGNRSIG